jgi:hypothetical protein
MRTIAGAGRSRPGPALRRRDDDDGDVVRTACVVGRIDQRLDGGGRREVADRPGDRRVIDDAGEPVGAQQQPVTVVQGQVERVDLHIVGHADGARDDGAVRVGRDVLARDAALVEEGLDERVVVGELDEPVPPHEVGTRIADVHDVRVTTVDVHGGQCRAHALEVRIVVRAGATRHGSRRSRPR